MRTIIGIDPGASGGIAVLRPGWPPHVHKMPVSSADLFGIINASKADVALIEKVGATPQMGVTSAFKFGHGAGLVEMAVVAAGIHLEWVTPHQWQKYHRLVSKGKGRRKVGNTTVPAANSTEKKNRNKARAQELFPGLKITHAVADALLIADYGRAMQREEARA